MDELITPDYGLDESIEEPGGDGHDEFNDDTFGDDVPTGGDWAQDSDRLAQLHEKFLAERQGGGGFFDLNGAADDDLGALEHNGSELSGSAMPELTHNSSYELDLDASLRDMLDISSPPRQAPTAPAGQAVGLRVSGLPPTLSEEQARQLLSHFGPLSSFELRPGSMSSTAMLSYQNPVVAQSACASLQGIPLGGSVLDVEVVAMPTAPRTVASAAGDVAQPFSLHGNLLSASLPPSQASVPGACPVAPLDSPPIGPAGPQLSTSLPSHQPPLPPMPSHAAAPQGQGAPIHGRGQPPPPPPMQPPPPVGMPVYPAMPQLPPHIRQAMSQVAHLPIAQQQALLAQMMAEHQRTQVQMNMLRQANAAGQQNFRRAPEDIDISNVRVSKRMTGQELQLIIRHQAMQVQMNDPVADDFYHHFWTMKGGRSKATRLALNVPQVKTSTIRAAASSDHISASLGAGPAAVRTPMARVGAPKPLIEMPTSQAEPGTPPTGGLTAPGGITVPGAPLAAPRWVLRRQIASARDGLIELRVHASSPAVHTPAGQHHRRKLVDRLFLLLHDADVVASADPNAPLTPALIAGDGVSDGLFTSTKGQKLASELVPLFPVPMVATVLRSAVRNIGAIAQLRTSHVPAFSASLASAPRSLPVEQASALLLQVAEQPQAVLREGLQRPEVQALVLGLLCHPNMSTTAAAAAQRFYEVVAMIAVDSDKVWDLLDAIVPSADPGHLAILRSLGARLKGMPLNDACSNRLDEFRAALG